MLIVRSRGMLDSTDSNVFEDKNADIMEAINLLAQKKLSRDEVEVRSMYLCSSQFCEVDGCRFSDQALEQICRKIAGESVLAGHDKRSLPVARFFKAAVMERADVSDPETGQPTLWVRAWFYWLKGTQSSRDLALNIDGGIYREVSISWRYRGGRCSVCERRPRSCPHVPGQRYDGVLCYTWIDDIVDVLEGSLVYRGADRQTGITTDHQDEPTEEISPLERMLLFELGPITASESRS